MNVFMPLLPQGYRFYHRDNMPEAVGVLFDKEVQGFGEMFRYLSHGEIGMSTLQSRAVAGMANNTVIFLLTRINRSMSNRLGGYYQTAAG